MCAECGKHNASENVQIDHVKACGQFLGPDDEQQYVWNLLFGELQVLCKDPCHKKKTATERKEAARLRRERKNDRI